MKLLYVVNALTIGGAQVLLVDLVNAALQRGHDVRVAAFRDGLINERLLNLGIKPVILGEQLLDTVPCYKLISLINEFKPNVIHTHLFRATAICRLAKLISRSEAKLVTTIHGLETDAYHIIEGLMQPFSDYMLFPSNFLAEWYCNNIKKLSVSQYRVIYPGVVLNDTGNLKKPQKPIIGTLSRLHHVKGIDILLQAAKILKERNLDFEINIGGGGKGKELLTELVNKLDISDVCRFVDDVSDKAGYLESLSIFVSPSRKEAFGINLCEAMERSLAVVSTEVGGIPEVVEAGVTGLLCMPENSKQLADKLEILIKDSALCKKFGQAGRRRIENLFNRAKAMEEHMELYENMTDNRKVHFAISSREMGGGEHLALDLVKNLQQRGWKVTATCAGNPLYKTLLGMGVECSVASMQFGGVLFASKLFQDLKTFKPNIVSSHLNKASLFAGLLSKATGIPCVSHVHGLNKKIYYQFSTKQVAVSSAVKKHLEDQGLISESLVAINNCIDKEPVGVRNFPDRPLNISITAKLHANKGHEWALKAINDNISKLNIGEIHLFGDGPERANLEALCASLSGIKKKVVFHGYVSCVDDFYGNIDLALLPSLGEGIPLSLLEVMRFGIPCISTNVGGVPEIIVNNESGILVEPKASEALIEAISRISEKNNYEFFSKGAFERFKQVNDHERMISDFEKLLLAVIKQ